MQTQPKQRDAAATKARIQEMAALKFTESGFDGVGIREIADAADVNVALISRYFGSKKKLFTEAILTRLSIEPLLQGPVEEWPENMADFMFNKARNADGIDPLVAVLRSAGSPSITPAIKHIFEEKIFDRLAGQLPAPSARQQAALIISLLFGFDSLRRIFGVADLTRHDQKKLRHQLVHILRKLTQC